MSRILRIGDKVRIKGTLFKGEIAGVGHTLSLMDSDINTLHPTAFPAATYIVRLSTVFLIVPRSDMYSLTYEVVKGRAPSSFPGSLFVHELTRSLDELELDE